MKGKLLMRIPEIDYNAKLTGYTWITIEVDVPVHFNESSPLPEVVGIEWIKEGK